MYTLKLTRGYVDEPETWTTEALGTYESMDEACREAESKFRAIMADLTDEETYVGNVEACYDDYYVTYGDLDAELGCVVADHYYEVNVIER